MADLVQVIDGDGGFHADELARFMNDSRLGECRTNYQIVAIMGPQSSGKSTLMNHLFGTSFIEMDAMSGRQQTTKGVWLGKSPKVDDPVTLVMDLEGSDGRERGEDDTNFERQTALFALAVADVLLVNVWCHDIGREQGSGKPLMKTIFQVNLKLFAPDPSRRKTVLLFVIRDKTKTPLSRLTEILGEDLQRMWASLTKPAQYVDSSISDFFEIRFAAMPHYEEKYEDFKADTTVLRRRFSSDEEGSPDSLVSAGGGDRLPADALALSTQQIWNVIRSQKDLNLPAHKVMVANIRCKEIQADQLRAFSSDQAWQGLEQEAGEGLVPEFGGRAWSLMDSCVKGYDSEASYFDIKVQEDNRTQLLERLHAAIAVPFGAQARRLADQELASFEDEFSAALAHGAAGFSAAADAARRAALQRFDAGLADLLVQGTPLTGDDVRRELEARLDAAVAAAKSARVKEVLHAVERGEEQSLTLAAVELLQACPPGLWPKMHAARSRAVADAQVALDARLVGVRLEEAERRTLSGKLAAAAERKLAAVLQEAALTRVTRMRDCFNEAFSLDDHKTPRSWRPSDNIPVLARAARQQAAGVLAALAVVRGADYQGGDVVEQALLSLARSDADDRATSSSSFDAGASTSSSLDLEFDLTTAASWPGVEPDCVLISPPEARAAWREFVSASNLAVQQAQLTQQANLAAGKRTPPLWALAAIMFLGWNELMAVLFSPFYLLLGGAILLFGWQLYTELDVDAEMQHGLVPGLISIGAKLWPTMQSVLLRTVGAVQALAQDGGHGAREAGSPERGGGANAGHLSGARRAQGSDGLTRRRAATEGVQMTSLAGLADGNSTAVVREAEKDE